MNIDKHLPLLHGFFRTPSGTSHRFSQQTPTETPNTLSFTQFHPNKDPPHVVVLAPTTYVTSSTHRRRSAPPLCWAQPRARERHTPGEVAPRHRVEGGRRREARDLGARGRPCQTAAACGRSS